MQKYEQADHTIQMEYIEENRRRTADLLRKMLFEKTNTAYMTEEFQKKNLVKIFVGE